MSRHKPHITLRFYARLNDFLPADHRQTDFQQSFSGKVSVKDLIESAGVPHTEIGLILVHNKAVDFNYHAHDNERISVYPPFRQFDISEFSRTGATPLSEIKFVLDTHLGKLAKYLRMLGFDTRYSNTYADAELAAISVRENRILLTRDRGLLKHGIIKYGYFVRTTGSARQLQEVISEFDLKSLFKPFSRCIRCNGKLTKVDKTAITQQLQPRTKNFYQNFKQCSDCQRIYWQGSHYSKMLKLISALDN